MDYLSFLPVGIPASSRLVYRPVYPQVVVPPAPTPTEVPGGGTSKRDKRLAKRKRVIRFSDLDERERIEALKALPVRPAPIAPDPIPFDELPDEDDELFMLVLMRLLH